MAQFEYDTDKNDISHVRFGGFGAAGSETWITGQKMKPYQIQKLKELLKSVESDNVKVKDKPDKSLENMFE